MPTSRGIVAARCTSVGHARRWPGVAMLVPGAPQWFWHQRERAILLGGSYAAALGVGAFAWGTAVGAVLVAFAYAVHVLSAADAIAQWAFPGFGRRVPTVAAALALAGGIYGPLAVLGALVAWPCAESHGPRSGVAVDRLAYRGQERPTGRGDHVWLAPGAGERGGRLARVLARPGDEVAWSRGRLEVDGRRWPRSAPARSRRRSPSWSPTATCSSPTRPTTRSRPAAGSSCPSAASRAEPGRSSIPSGTGDSSTNPAARGDRPGKWTWIATSHSRSC
jgi:hypothetical protein